MRLVSRTNKRGGTTLQLVTLCGVAILAVVGASRAITSSNKRSYENRLRERATAITSVTPHDTDYEGADVTDAIGIVPQVDGSELQVPMFGVRENGTVHYVNGAVRRAHNADWHYDYRSLQAKLNATD
jgi:hypothetical protein